MEKPPLISLITVVKNGATTLRRMLDSVRSQRFRDFELIVLDGASSDGTQEIAQEYADCITFFRSAPDKGANDAFNQALALTKGKIIGLLMADDWLEAGALETVAKLAEQNPEAGIFSFGLQEYENDRPMRYFCDSPCPRFTLEDGMYCQGLARFYAAELVKNVGLYNVDRYPKLCDREWYMRFGLLEPLKARSETPVYAFRFHAGSVSASATKQETRESLEQMRHIARDYLAANLHPHQQNAVKKWYCFTMVRLLAYRLFCRDILGFVNGFFEAVLSYPLRFMGHILNHRMPAPYRPRNIA